jgi:hypothetical protein
MRAMTGRPVGPRGAAGETREAEDKLEPCRCSSAPPPSPPSTCRPERTEMEAGWMIRVTGCGGWTADDEGVHRQVLRILQLQHHFESQIATAQRNPIAHCSYSTTDNNWHLAFLQRLEFRIAARRRWRGGPQTARFAGFKLFARDCEQNRKKKIQLLELRIITSAGGGADRRRRGSRVGR